MYWLASCYINISQSTCLDLACAADPFFLSTVTVSQSHSAIFSRRFFGFITGCATYLQLIKRPTFATYCFRVGLSLVSVASRCKPEVRNLRHCVNQTTDLPISQNTQYATQNTITTIFCVLHTSCRQCLYIFIFILPFWQFSSVLFV